MLVLAPACIDKGRNHKGIHRQADPEASKVILKQDMPKYVALLRGIAPTNHNMRNDKLQSVFERLGFENVKTVISSGNVILEMYDGPICSVVDLTSARPPDLMGWLEKKFGKEITTRTWNTVERIRKAMS